MSRITPSSIHPALRVLRLTPRASLLALALFGCAHKTPDVNLKTPLDPATSTGLHSFYLYGDPFTPGDMTYIVISHGLAMKGYERMDRIQWADFAITYGIRREEGSDPLVVFTAFDNRAFKACSSQLPASAKACRVDPGTTLFNAESGVDEQDPDGSEAFKEIIGKFPSRAGP